MTDAEFIFYLNSIIVIETTQDKIFGKKNKITLCDS